MSKKRILASLLATLSMGSSAFAAKKVKCNIATRGGSRKIGKNPRLIKKNKSNVARNCSIGAGLVGTTLIAGGIAYWQLGDTIEMFRDKTEKLQKKGKDVGGTGEDKKSEDQVHEPDTGLKEKNDVEKPKEKEDKKPKEEPYENEKAAFDAAISEFKREDKIGFIEIDLKKLFAALGSDFLLGFRKRAIEFGLIDGRKYDLHLKSGWAMFMNRLYCTFSGDKCLMGDNCLIFLFVDCMVADEICKVGKKPKVEENVPKSKMDRWLEKEARMKKLESQIDVLGPFDDLDDAKVKLTEENLNYFSRLLGECASIGFGLGPCFGRNICKLEYDDRNSESFVKSFLEFYNKSTSGDKEMLKKVLSLETSKKILKDYAPF